MLAWIATLMIVTMKLFPDLPVARGLHLWLAVKPAKWLSQARRHHVLFVLVLMAMLLTPEMLMVASAVDLSLVTFALDVSFYLDGMIVMALAGALARTTAGWRALRVTIAARCRPLARARRRRDKARAQGRAANDDAEDRSDRIAARLGVIRPLSPRPTHRAPAPPRRATSRRGCVRACAS